MSEPHTSLFNRIRFVLVQTSHPGNIGAAARALKTMGFCAPGSLVLVQPRFADALQHEEALAFASGAQDVLAGARVVETVAQALEGCHFTAALSARLREFSPPVCAPRQLAQDLAQQMRQQEQLQAAILFGSERYGLPNQVVQDCNVLVNIPANPAYSSLNLAQAVQLLAWEMRMAADSEQNLQAPRLPGFSGAPASAQQVEGMYQHLEQALITLGFLDADHPKKLMPRLKRLFGRTGLEVEEVNILRGIASHILQTRKKPD
ncbi:RNA methyltransferase [Massilia sp. W12]|uniref:RNA methyltransferase n=1 Tax=Massilia sp. W12 TaxID=3126507 RepID=UPI0030D19CC6